MNKRQAAESLGISEVTLSDWQRRGAPYVPAATRGHSGDYDPESIRAWADRRGLGGPRVNPSGRGHRFDTDDDWLRELGGAVLGHTLSEAFIPACTGMMCELGISSARAMQLFGYLSLALQSAHNRLCEREVNIEIVGILEELTDDDGKERVLAYLDECFAQAQAKS